jgi:hypothetical protein
MARLRVYLENGRTVEANLGVWILAILQEAPEPALARMCDFAEKEQAHQSPNGGGGIQMPGAQGIIVP